MVYDQTSISFVVLEVLWHNGVSSWNHRFDLRLSLSWVISDNTEETVVNVNETPKLELFSCVTGKPECWHGKYNGYQDTLSMSHHPYPLPKNAYLPTIQHFRLKINLFPVKLSTMTLTKRFPPYTLRLPYYSTHEVLYPPSSKKRFFAYHTTSMYVAV